MFTRGNLWLQTEYQQGKRDCISLREKIAELQKDIHDGIDVVGKKMTLCQLYAKQNAQRPKVRKTLKLDANILWIF